ncbi:MAG: hypothetical protein V2I43_02245 [Parvularcula sp.]|jgi:hypothetical protein|nr:hypothetical protein [Parvularcula sp.]
MDISKRQELYKQALKKDTGATTKTSFRDALGVSNSAKIIGRGLFCFNLNLENLAADVDQLVVHCLLRFPPEDEIYFSIFIKADMMELRARLAEMKAVGTSKPWKRKVAEDEDTDESEQAEAAQPAELETAASTAVSDGDVGEGGDEASGTAAAPVSPDGLDYAATNNNVRGYLAQDGLLYLRNKGYFDELPEDLSTISRPVKIEKIVFGIYPPAAAARRSLLAREFVGYLGSLIGRERIHEVRTVWPETNAVSPEMARMPTTLTLNDIEAAIRGLGGYYPNGELTRYHAGMNFLKHKHFVILSGLSGTGKTQLALLYARAIHGKKARDENDPFLFVCPVRPEWTDPAGLTGYYDVLTDRYVVPPFLEAVLVATAFRDSPVFVILDEMNLARVEYYFSDVLSAIETGEAIPLHSNDVPLEGTTGSSIPASLPLPPNLYITGTINIDETTNPVSDKVLDRAILIEMNDVDVDGYITKIETEDPDLATACAHCRPHLVATQAVMQPNRLGFGYRLIREVIAYHHFAVGSLAQDADGVLDQLMVQKLLVKLRGSEAQRSMLDHLGKQLAAMPRSKALLDQLGADLDEYGAFQANR